MKSINVYDFDGVVSIGVTPRVGDIICTGRTIDEYGVVYSYLDSIGLLGKVIVYFNPINYETRGDHTTEARTYSGNHKANIIKSLISNGVKIGHYFEDDPLQIEIVCQHNPEIIDKVIKIQQSVEF